MSDKRTRTVFTEKHNQEGLHARFKGPISALNDLMKDASFAKHRKTLDEISKAITRALENDQKWSMKVKMLQAEIDSNESRMKIALELSEKDKNMISSLQNELKTAWNIVEELKRAKKDYFQNKDTENNEENSEKMEEKNDGRERSVENERDGDDRQAKRKARENEKLLEEMAENQDQLQNEIERMKLQIFELEEEMTNKEKCIEELTSALSYKSKMLDNIAAQNMELRKLLDELQAMSNSDTTEDNKKPNGTKKDSKEEKLKKIINNLKKKLRDTNKRDQISLEKVKHLIKKNQMLSKQLQINKNHNNLMKLELDEQKKMLDLLSCQFCKLEESNKIQAVLIAELENIRNKYMHMVGSLEQEIHEIKKRARC